ncbi:MAG: hypothetical protein DRP90_03790 [Planctomycetota bacterium]|nr:MAG: hypothetical protein DRP90_03790 [Planctomycetota bacterium]
MKKFFKFALLALLVFLILVVLYAFWFWGGVKSVPEWYSPPPPMPTHLADSIFKRTKDRLLNAYNAARADPRDPGKAIFSFIADNRTLEAWVLLHLDDEMEEYGFTRPQVQKVGENTLRVFAEVTKGPLAGAVLYTTVKLSATPDGKLLVEPGPIMAGKRKVPSFVTARIEERTGRKWGPFEVAPSEIPVPADEGPVHIGAKLLKVEVGDKETVFTLKRLK